MTLAKLTIEKRIALLRSYLRQGGFKGVWLNREDLTAFLELVDTLKQTAT